ISGPLDLAGYARSLGAQGATVHTREELVKALSESVTADLPTLVDVRTDPGVISPSATLGDLLDCPLRTPVPRASRPSHTEGPRVAGPDHAPWWVWRKGTAVRSLHHVHHGTKDATTATVQSSRSSSMAAARSSGQGLENSTGRRSVGCTKPRRTACNH